jgi:hypothetical protein
METTHVLGIFVGWDAYIEAFLLGSYTSVRLLDGNLHMHWTYEMGTETCIRHLRWYLTRAFDILDGNGNIH